MSTSSRLRAIIVGGTIAATLDILFAITWAAINGRTPTWLLQTVATGLLGESAYAGGIPAVILGLASHFALSYGWATLFVTAASRLPGLVSKPAFTGPAFGILVFFAMRLVMLPLSAFPYPVSFSQPGATFDLLSHMFFFGLPIAFAAARSVRAGKPG